MLWIITLRLIMCHVFFMRMNVAVRERIRRRGGKTRLYFPPTTSESEHCCVLMGAVIGPPPAKTPPGSAVVLLGDEVFNKTALWLPRAED